MGDIRFIQKYSGFRASPDRAGLIKRLREEDLVEILAGASLAADGYIANVLASELLNRMARSRRAPNFKALYQAAPASYVILTPEFEVVDASPEYLRTSMTRLSEIRGEHVFDVFPDPPTDPTLSAPRPEGMRNLKASFQRVLDQAAREEMSPYRYDIPLRPQKPDVFVERHWKPLNSPILAADGSVEFIVHKTVDVTPHTHVYAPALDRGPVDT